VSGSAKRSWGLALALCAVVVALDQGAKALIEANLDVGEKVSVLGPIDLTLSYNSGVAFGLAGGGGKLLIPFALVALGLIGALFARDPTRPGMWVAIGLVTGGAVGNLADRALAGEVTDYVDILAWPAFNLADVAITVGVGLLVLIFLRDE
jgi:signal peptidase II